MADSFDFTNADTSPIVEGNDADFNNDGTVNGQDFLIWQRGFGSTDLINNINGIGDANNDGVVDAGDLAVWQSQYGLGGGVTRVGSPAILSMGASGAANVINSNLNVIDESLEIGGSKDLVINGDFGNSLAPEQLAASQHSGIHAVSAGMRVEFQRRYQRGRSRWGRSR